MKAAYFLTTLAALTCAACNTAQSNSQPSGQNSQENPLAYNPNKIVTYKGQIIQTMDIFDPTTSSDTVGIVVQTEKGAIPVILGPRCYTSGGPMLNPGQAITVTGSEISMSGSTILIASEAQLDNYTLKLRSKEGNPLWSGWHKN